MGPDGIYQMTKAGAAQRAMQAIRWDAKLPYSGKQGH